MIGWSNIHMLYSQDNLTDKNWEEMVYIYNSYTKYGFILLHMMKTDRKPMKLYYSHSQSFGP